MTNIEAIKRYHKRVDKRLDKRGVKFKGYRYEINKQHEDASQRLAFGLCEKYGIELPEGAMPKDAWAALQEKTGKSPSEFYQQSGDNGADKIKFSTASPKTFVKKLSQAIAAQDPKKGWRVTGLSKQELAANHPNAKIHVTDGGSTIAIDNGDIVAVCVGPNDGKGGIQSGGSLLQFAVKNGGTKLDSYTGNHKFYIKNGFEPVSWCKWDDDFAGEEWLKVNGYTPEQWENMDVKPSDKELKVPREPIVFYKYVGVGKTTYPQDDLSAFLNKVNASDSYDEAKKNRDRSLEGKR
jgi:hypothetical protein